jgi:hypothetical protein
MLPQKGDSISDDWEDFFIEWPDYGSEHVPSRLQAFVNEAGKETSPRALGVGRHPEHGLFVAEFVDGAGELFVGWWTHLNDARLGKGTQP